LTRLETQGYISERLRIAGSTGEEIFGLETIEAVHRQAGGIPCITNLLCEHALINALSDTAKLYRRKWSKKGARF